MSTEVKRLELDIDLKDDDIWRYMHTRRPLESLAEEVAWARERVRELEEAKVAQRRFAVERLEPYGVVLEGDIKLESAALLDYFQGAEVALLMAVTIGPRLEEEVNRLFAQDQAVKALVLDAAGSAFLRRAGEHVHREAFLEAWEEGMTTGPCLSPGGAFWDLTGQRTIFQALPLDRIGVQLLESCFMRPRKSNTRVLPMGRHLKVKFHPDDSHCKLCKARYCLARRE